MRAASERERRLWGVAGGIVAAIYASSYFVQFALDFLRERNLLRVTIGVAFALAAGAVVAALVRRGAGWRAWSALATVAAVYAVAALALEIVQERIHLLEYGALSLVVRGALEARAAFDPGFGFRSAAAASGGGFALAFLAGAGDEMIQGALPNRHGELRDIGLNACAAALALLAAGAVELALRRDGAVRAREAAR